MTILFGTTLNGNGSIISMVAVVMTGSPHSLIMVTVSVTVSVPSAKPSALGVT
jgi:hypothetical protein